MAERPPFEVASLDELERIPVGDEGLTWRPVRRQLGIEAFGVNAYTVERAGDEIVERHDETGHGAGKHEELYFVARGRARFTLDGEAVDAPAGTFVFVRDPSVTRGASAEEPGTTVLALGGKPGEPFRISPWEYYFAAIPAYRAKDYGRALGVVREGLERHPDNPSILFTLACLESLSGERDAALQHLRRAVERNPKLAEEARTDPDLDPIRDDPEFASAISGEASSAGSGS